MPKHSPILKTLRARYSLQLVRFLSVGLPILLLLDSPMGALALSTTLILTTYLIPDPRDSHIPPFTTILRAIYEIAWSFHNSTSAFHKAAQISNDSERANASQIATSAFSESTGALLLLYREFERTHPEVAEISLKHASERVSRESGTTAEVLRPGLLLLQPMHAALRDVLAEALLEDSYSIRKALRDSALPSYTYQGVPLGKLLTETLPDRGPLL
jgi:hypothetical protein